jgi:hypothetical protein
MIYDGGLFGGFKIYPDMKFKNTTVDLEGVFPCCSQSVLRRFKENEVVAEGADCICDECGDGVALFNGVWSAVRKVRFGAAKKGH